MLFVHDTTMSGRLPPLVAVDFNGMLARKIVSLETAGVHWDLERQHLHLKEGMRVRAYDLDAENGVPDNLIAEGTVKRLPSDRAEGGGHWVLKLDYLGHESDFRGSKNHWVNKIDWQKEVATREEWQREHAPGQHPAAHQAFEH
jgi:hypothetical protein